MLSRISLLATLAVVLLGHGVSVQAATLDDLDLLLKRTSTLRGGAYQETLEQTIRKLKDPGAQRAVCLYVLALVDADVPGFMALVPTDGIRWKKESYDAKPVRRRLSRAEVEKRSVPHKDGARPEFLGVLGDVSDADPKTLSWNVNETRGRIQVAANGAFAWAMLAKTPGKDGSFLISEIELSINND